MIKIAAAYKAFLHEKRLDTFAAWSRHFFPEGLPVKNRVHVRKMQLVGRDGKEIEVYFKQYEHKRPSWRFWGRPSKARCEYRNYGVFQNLGIPGATPVAFGEERDMLGRLARAFIVTRAVPDSVTLVEFFERDLPGFSRVEQRKIRAELIRQLAAITKVLHQASFYHGDLVWRNVLVTGAPDLAPKLWLIDCPRGKYVHWTFLQRRGQKRDLGSLDKLASRWCSRKERAQFLKLYLDQSRLDEEARVLIREVRAYSKRRWPDDWIDD